VKFLNSISRGGDLPLDDVVRNVNSNITVTAKKEAIRGDAYSRITAVVIGELYEGEKSCPDGLIISGISAQIVLDYSVEGVALAISLGVVGS
jgi:hypothetical protein